MRQSFKDCFPYLKQLLKSDFIDGEIYTVDHSSVPKKPIITMNYSDIANAKQISAAIMKNNHLYENDKMICKKILNMLYEVSNDKTIGIKPIDDIYIVVNKKCILELKKRKLGETVYPTIIYLTTEEKDYGWLWGVMGRPIYKRLGWRILE